MPCNLTTASDGRIFFTEGSYRYDLNNWINDAVECRPNGRIIVYEPATRRTRTLLGRLVYPSGICMAADGRSFVFAETWLCRISRYWLSGPKAGTVEIVADNLPAYPANISLAPDGGYWVAMLAGRTPSSDLLASD
jgi:ribose transport system permease protein